MDTASDRLPNLIIKGCAFEVHWANIPRDKTETDSANAADLFKDASALNVLRTDMLALAKTQNDEPDVFQAEKYLVDFLKRCSIITNHMMERFGQISQHFGVIALAISPYPHNDVPSFELTP